MLNTNDLPETPIIKESSELFQNSIIHITCDLLQKKRQAPYPYYTLNVRPFAVILLVFTKEKLPSSSITNAALVSFISSNTFIFKLNSD